MVNKSIAYLCVCLATLLLATSINAQQRTTLAFRFSEHSNLGYEPHSPGIQLTREQVLSKKLVLDLGASVERARKKPGGGYGFGGSATLRIYPDRKFFISAGARYTRQITNIYEKGGAGLNIGAGYESGPVRLSATALLPDNSINRVRGVEFGFDYYRKTERRAGLFLGWRAQVLRFDYEGDVRSGFVGRALAGVYFQIRPGVLSFLFGERR